VRSVIAPELAAASLGGVAILVVALALPGTLLTAWVGGRLLGVRRSFSLTVASGFFGWLVGIGISLAIAGQRSNPNTGFIRNVLLFSAFGSLVASVWIEFLARPGAMARAQTGLSSIPRPIRSLRRRGHRVQRYAQITAIAARQGLGPALGMGRQTRHERAPVGRRLRVALEDAGGMFVKLGQVLSTRPDLVSDDVAAELSKLQDAVPPVGPDELASVLEEELGAPVEAVFAEFDWSPVAAASIGQAHRARLHGGDVVIVKVQRPGVAELVDRDLEVLARVAEAIESRTSWGARWDVRGIAREFSERLREELDYLVEAQNAVQIGGHLPAGSQVRVPRVYPDLTTPRVLVMEWLDGVSVRQADRVDALGVDRSRLAGELLRTVLGQILGDGRFHSDPHPGNVMVLADGRLGLIDFGATGVLDPLEQTAVREMMYALANNDPDLLRQALLRVADVHSPVDDEALERALARFIGRHLGAGAKPSPAMFNELLHLLHDFDLSVATGLSTFFRALVTLDGTLRTMAPGFETIDEAERAALEMVGDRLMPENVEAIARAELIKLLPTLRRVPRQLDRIVTATERDGLRVRVSLLSEPRDVVGVTRLVNRFVLAILGAGVGGVSVALIAIRGGPPFTGGTSLFRFFGYFGLFCSTVLIMRVLVAVLRDGVN
jgi:ubiquinone biosynthesis protein